MEGKRGLLKANALFADVMEGSVFTTTDPRSCIPFTNIRLICRSGVKRMKRIFRGMGCAEHDGAGESIGFVAGPDAPLATPLTGTFSRYVAEYFVEEKGMTTEESIEHAASREIWYGVVDGMHRLVAILELIEEEPESWDGFNWTVTILKGGVSLQVLEQLARHQNLKHSQKCYVETTLYDSLRGLKDESERLVRIKNGKRPSAKEIADAYDGCTGLKDRTIQQMATTALRLQDAVIEAIGEIMMS